MKKSLNTFLMAGLAMGLWASAVHAGTSISPLLNVTNVVAIQGAFNNDLTHRFDDINLKNSKGISTTLRGVFTSADDLPTQANIDRKTGECVIDINMAQLDALLQGRAWSVDERTFFIKFAVLHERFHCVGFDDKEAVWLPGTLNRERITNILSEQAHASPMTMFLEHPAAYEFLHEEMADGMAIVALLKEYLDHDNVDSTRSIGSQLPDTIKAMVHHILAFRMQASAGRGDVHGTLRMLDFVLHQPGALLNQSLTNWYKLVQQQAGLDLIDAYKRSGMDTILDPTDMWYDIKTSTINLSMKEASVKPTNYKERIVSEMRQQLFMKGIMPMDAHNAEGNAQLDRQTIKNIDAFLQNQTLGWFDSMEWNDRLKELNAVNAAYKANQTPSSLDVEQLSQISGQMQYMQEWR